ncbi:uncharacterized protein BDZ99DRAFT_36281 [Mytilinidion resinicola]|uniref:Uncharacterized protein n=1 Tax=Mytilinidion resinicola TaxID=574789 RepID=A0A6A6YPI6_9PEZI|nr:uncharacterized protein BDZ99DRAFT_36281 [Mytilinidion resinicola]KAF2809777.1 hypothetical protein BDZ99DRAFT_36281 [Mytilinidion resinicola]
MPPHRVRVAPSLVHPFFAWHFPSHQLSACPAVLDWFITPHLMYISDQAPLAQARDLPRGGDLHMRQTKHVPNEPKLLRYILQVKQNTLGSGRRTSFNF